MDEATQARVFEPFFTTRAQGQGTGLGLSIVYGLVRQWSGAITLWSRSGQGTMLSIYLPVADGVPEQASPPSRQVGPRGSETVLVADDEPPVRRLLCRVLSRSGYRVIDASDGADALDQAGAHAGAIDLLLTDVVMPRMGGVALARRLRTERPGLPVLFFSGHPDERTEGSTDEVVEASFLQKPCTPDELLAKVRETLDAASAAGAAGGEGSDS